MAKPKFLFQGIRQHNDHETAIRTFLEIDPLDKMIFGVAFVRENGVWQIRDFIKQHSRRTVIYAGIRNGITSAQGLFALLDLKVKIYSVDTGSTSTIFHPKAYISFNDSEGRVIIGSANLTLSGLHQNIEASTLLAINRQDHGDEQFLGDLVSSITSLQDNFPEHVVAVQKKTDITRMLRQGRVEDESIAQPIRGAARVQGKWRDQLPMIKLFRNRREPVIKPPKRRIIPPVHDGWVLVWVSKGLTERDLNIPTGLTTNPTGSMLLKKGKIEGIDQRSHFRQKIFCALDWRRDSQPSLSHLERAEAEFEIIIKGINLGKYNLKLTHNSRTDTRSYEQLNAMTQIHWGVAKDFVAHRDLLGREFRLYQRINNPQQFLVEID
ncbi:phospholipase D family protein [candidate division KSB1 bacterium]|nr:phospholipase D family protein [candidate division KSB1 bacterium]